MASVQLISGRIVENVKVTNVEHVGDEGARRALAHIDGKTYPVYNSIIDGFNTLWVEQMSFETYQMLKDTTGFVEGSATPLEVSHDDEVRDELARQLRIQRGTDEQ